VDRARTRRFAVSEQRAMLFVDFDGFANCGQFRFAGTAFADIGKVLGGNAIGSTAARAISNQLHGRILIRFSRSSGTHFAHQSARQSRKNWGF
jgi:hypothetical protein